MFIRYISLKCRSTDNIERHVFIMGCPTLEKILLFQLSLSFIKAKNLHSRFILLNSCSTTVNNGQDSRWTWPEGLFLSMIYLATRPVWTRPILLPSLNWGKMTKMSLDAMKNLLLWKKNYSFLQKQLFHGHLSLQIFSFM